MALISCPECGKEISNYADSCPHCGFPIKKEKEESELFNIILTSTTFMSDCRVKTAEFLQNSLDMSFKEAIKLVESTPSTIFVNISKQNAIRIKNQLEGFGCSVIINKSNNKDNSGDNEKIDSFFENAPNGIMCPRCRSGAVTKGCRGYSLVWGFIGSSKTVNVCNQCGYRWG